MHETSKVGTNKLIQCANYGAKQISKT